MRKSGVCLWVCLRGWDCAPFLPPSVFVHTPSLPLQVTVMAETRNADHAREMFQALRDANYGPMTMTGLGGALGIKDGDDEDGGAPQRQHGRWGRPDSGMDIKAGDDSLSSSEEDGGGGGSFQLSVPVVRDTRRNSAQFSIAELSLG